MDFGSKKMDRHLSSSYFLPKHRWVCVWRKGPTHDGKCLKSLTFFTTFLKIRGCKSLYIYVYSWVDWANLILTFIDRGFRKDYSSFIRIVVKDTSNSQDTKLDTDFSTEMKFLQDSGFTYIDILSPVCECFMWIDIASKLPFDDTIMQNHEKKKPLWWQ